MRVEKTQNTPNFGMSYYLKGSKDINNYYYKYYLASKQIHVYANLKSGVCARGYQQFQREMNNLHLYDVVFDHETRSMQVIERASDKVVAEFKKSPKHSIGTPKRFVVKKIYDYIFNPKEFLPQNMLLAGKKAEELEMQALGITEK